MEAEMEIFKKNVKCNDVIYLFYKLFVVWLLGMVSLFLTSSYKCFFCLFSFYLFPVFLIFNRIHSTAWFSIQHEVKSGIFAETTGVAQEGVFFIIVDRPEKCQPPSKNPINPKVSSSLWELQRKHAAHLHLWHWYTFSPQLPHTPGLAGTEALQRGHCRVSVEAW